MTSHTLPAYRLTAALVALLALTSVGLDTYEALMRHPERSLGEEIWRRLRYFTILTNLLVVLGFAAAALTGKMRATTGAALTLWIGIVAIVYHTLLFEEHTGLRWWTDHGMHTIVPIAVALWWVAYAPKFGLRMRQAAYWLAFPSLYVVYVLLRGAADGVYPYFFLDPVKSGWGGLGLWVLALGAGFWLGGVLVIWLAGRMATQRITL
ncbi:MAG: Pr6Pr family membrane protein [Rhodobacteraceae bacterium]|nr:Pr6Pr family membrane protein [Paracoccaceae bacterium]